MAAATVRLYPNGTKGGIPGPGSKTPPKRGRCGGWSMAACRRNTSFLYSVDCQLLTGRGLSLTLTLLRCPVDHAEWERLRQRFVKRLRRMGLMRAHWVTEWQARGVPHLHGATYFDAVDHPPAELRRRVVQAWLDVARDHEPGLSGQHVEAIYDARGWWQYVSKHAARGIGHYQRNPDNMPAGWQGITGRMWGKIGSWPTVEPEALVLEQTGWWALRRLVRSWRRANARTEGSASRIAQARRMLSCGDRRRSSVRGWSEWIPEEIMAAMVANVAMRGHDVRG